MSHLLHLDSSITGDASVSRRLTARAADGWRKAHPDGTVTYRDLGKHPVPHLDEAGGMARLLPKDQRTPAQHASWELTEELVGEIQQADVVLLGLPLYNYGPPSSVKAWVDHLVAPGLSFDPETRAGLLGGRDLVIIATRGGGYGAGTPREGWDHAESWLPHGVDVIGLEPRFITAELTLANMTPAMAGLIPLADESMAAAERSIDALWLSQTSAV
jgi:FMN-dependent NADH-azoreductase